MFDAQRAAAQIIADGQREAERLLAAARADAERLRAVAAAEGREAGLATVTELLIGARSLVARARDGAAGDLRALAVRIAERILGRTLELSPGAVTDVAAQAMTLVGKPRQVLMRCHPEDLAALEAARPRLRAAAARAEVIALRPDPSLSRGGCVIETELGVVDARIEVQLEAIERALGALEG
jgi:type III secretion protein L